MTTGNHKAQVERASSPAPPPQSLRTTAAPPPRGWTTAGAAAQEGEGKKEGCGDVYEGQAWLTAERANTYRDEVVVFLLSRTFSMSGILLST